MHCGEGADGSVLGSCATVTYNLWLGRQQGLQSRVSLSQGLVWCSAGMRLLNTEGGHRQTVPALLTADTLKHVSGVFLNYSSALM